MNIVFSVDWAQYSCCRLCARDSWLQVNHHVQGHAKLGAWCAPRYKVVPGKEHSPQFRESYTLMSHGIDVCHIFFSPASDCLDESRCIFKAANRLLYTQGWAAVLQDIVHTCNCYIVSLSRLDVCADFNAFQNGVLPGEFVRRFFNAPTATTPSYIRHSSNKFRTYGQKNTFEDGRAPEVDFQTLSFGSRESAVQTNLYNKSEELRTHDKPYIRDTWVAAGLDPENVWRVEFSLNSRGVCFRAQSGTMIRELALEEVALQDYLADLFLSLAQSHFSFHEYFAGDTRGIRSLPYADLFAKPEKVVLKVAHMNVKRNSGRTEILVAKTLERLMRDAQNDSPERLQAYHKVIEEVRQLGSVKMAAARQELAPEDFMVAFASNVTTIPADDFKRICHAYQARAKRLLSMFFASEDEDVLLYREAFWDILERWGILDYQNMLTHQEREEVRFGMSQK